MADTGSGSGIGARLRAGREKMGLTQLQTAEKLHVDPKVVENLEAERFEALGAPVFVRGHLKRYAELIGEQTAELHDLYAAATKPVAPDLTRLPKAAPASNPSRLAVPALVVLIGFVLLGVVWWVVKSVSGSDGDKPKRGPQPVVIAPEVSRDPALVDEPVGDSGNAGAATANGAAAPGGASSGGSARSTARVGANGGAGAQPGTAARAPSSASSAAGTGASAATRGPAAASGAGVPGAAGAASGTQTGNSAAATPARAGKAMEVTLRFAADSWVEVYDANGEKLFYDVGAADSSRTVSGTPPFRVHVANAPGVTLDVNGKPAPVPANALKGDEAQFTINRAGRIVRALPKADGG